MRLFASVAVLLAVGGAHAGSLNLGGESRGPNRLESAYTNEAMFDKVFMIPSA